MACRLPQWFPCGAPSSGSFGNGGSCGFGYRKSSYLSVDRMPAFPGGEAALMTYLRDNISYPPEAEEKNIQGKVIVQFVVDSAGYVGDVKVVRSVDPNLDREAVRVIQTLPKFIPGARLGKPVNVWYTLPVSFVINNEISYLLSFIHEIDSIKIDYCNLNIDTPMAITPDNYDAGQFSQIRRWLMQWVAWQSSPKAILTREAKSTFISMMARKV